VPVNLVPSDPKDTIDPSARVTVSELYSSNDPQMNASPVIPIV